MIARLELKFLLEHRDYSIIPLHIHNTQKINLNNLHSISAKNDTKKSIKKIKKRLLNIEISDLNIHISFLDKKISEISEKIEIDTGKVFLEKFISFYNDKLEIIKLNQSKILSRKLDNSLNLHGKQRINVADFECLSYGSSNPLDNNNSPNDNRPPENNKSVSNNINIDV